jgi:hypothetical protein
MTVEVEISFDPDPWSVRSKPQLMGCAVQDYVSKRLTMRPTYTYSRHMHMAGRTNMRYLKFKLAYVREPLHSLLGEQKFTYFSNGSSHQTTPLMRGRRTRISQKASIEIPLFDTYVDCVSAFRK